jgi:signal transduction histidine kinase
MRERVRELAGVLELTSEGKGTVVKAVIPLSSAARHANHPAARAATQRAS